MKNLKKGINDLINGSKQKKEILVVSSNEPGKYILSGKIYNEKEFEILKQGYEKTVIFKKKES